MSAGEQAAEQATDETTSPEKAFAAMMDSGDAKAVVDFFRPLTEKERRTYVKPLREFLKGCGWRTSIGEDWRVHQDRLGRARRTLLPAAMAVFASAATTAKFLRSTQRSAVFSLAEPEATRQILLDRAPAWLAELPAALVAALAPEGAYRLVCEVREVAGGELTPTPEFVRAWASEYGWNRQEAILEDPWFAEVVPLVFDEEEADALFSTWAAFKGAVIVAVDEGRVPRGAVLDASLRRLLRGGRSGAMQDHLAFWNTMRATDEEVAERVSSCISLLSSQNGTVARSFLAALKKLSDTGLLDLDLAVEAASIAVTRSEKNVVKTALGWLDALVLAHPDRAGQLVGAIAIAFGSQAADLQERAVRLVGKHAKRLGEDERGRLVDEARFALAPDLAATLAGLLGVSAAPEMPSADSYPEAAPYVPRPLLPPIATPAELAESMAALIEGDPVEAMVFERLLEAFVLFARTDSAGLKEALEPVTARWQRFGEGPRLAMTPRWAVTALAPVATGTVVEGRRRPHRAELSELWSWTRNVNRPHRRTRTSPADVLVMRVAEVMAAFGMPDLPPLVSIPTSPTGSIEPEVLAGRLRECEAQGLVPLRADFHQALLRLPEDCGDRGLDVSGLTSKAGRRFAAWLDGDRIVLPGVELPDPAARRFENHANRVSYLRARTQDHVEKPSTLLDLVPGVWSEPERAWDGADWAVCWPAIVPSRPDLAAVAFYGGAYWTTAPASAESTVVLAEQDGSHTGTHHVIAARLVDDDARLRASGVDAALVLAARGLLDSAELSVALGRELGAAPGTLRRLVPGLRDIANGGAARQVWEAIAVVVPRIVPPAVPKTLSGTADLLVLGTELAGALGVRTPIAEVTALAEKKSGSAVTKAARRLAGVLAGG